MENKKRYSPVTSAVQWAAVEERLAQLFVCVDFLVDGHEVTVQRRHRESKSELLVFIDGSIKGSMTQPDKDTGDFQDVVKKVWRRSERLLWSKQQQKTYVDFWTAKRMGKRAIERMKKRLGFNKTYVVYLPSFGTAKALVRQFKKIDGIQEVEL